MWADVSQSCELGHTRRLFFVPVVPPPHLPHTHVQNLSTSFHSMNCATFVASWEREGVQSTSITAIAAALFRA